MSLTHTGVTTAAAELEPCGQPDHPDCGIRDVLDRVGDKWSVLVIVELAGGPRRFRQLQRAIDGISQRMLTLTVRRLERDGLVLRTVYQTVPAQVDYRLTETGTSLPISSKHSPTGHWHTAQPSPEPGRPTTTTTPTTRSGDAPHLVDVLTATAGENFRTPVPGAPTRGAFDIIIGLPITVIR